MEYRSLNLVRVSFSFLCLCSLEYSQIESVLDAFEHLECCGVTMICLGSISLLVTTSDSFLAPLKTLQNGGKPDSPEEVDPVKRYIRSARDLATTSATDTINT